MKHIHLSLIITTILIGGALMFSLNKPSAEIAPAVDNVTVVDGQQVIDITAKGGYSPRTSTAKAGIPTILRFHTTGTFDCSSYIRIPSMGLSKNLPSTGTVDIPVDSKAGALIGMCGMGMYPFQVNFQS
ncbi:MAG: cupredoxin domain-containing protein [bacterium]|nr:cupredoxin domain-containing protein [bacterium]